MTLKISIVKYIMEFRDNIAISFISASKNDEVGSIFSKFGKNKQSSSCPSQSSRVLYRF